MILRAKKYKPIKEAKQKSKRDCSGEDPTKILKMKKVLRRKEERAGKRSINKESQKSIKGVKKE